MLLRDGCTRRLCVYSVCNRSRRVSCRCYGVDWLVESGLLAYYDYRISTGPLEGTNNKIKTMQKQAYGFRDMDFFKLKIMVLHQTKYALVG